MLYVLFKLGNDRYALEAARVVEVVPLLALKKIPQSPKGVAGLMIYRGRPVPALDLCELTFGRPARELLSTRIIVINCGDLEVSGARGQVSGEKPDASHLTPDTAPLLGLIAEHATETLRRSPQDFVDAAPISGLAATPSLGPVLMDEKGVVQLLHAQRLLTGKVHDLMQTAEA